MLRNGLIVSLVILCAVLLCHCTPHSVCETQNEYDDSLSLAQAYSTLDNWQCIFPDDYAHACYHYGRLLCAKDNYVDAMKVFIKATHSRTRDFHILGRVYSNIAEMCHLAGEYQLSYDMFAKCADCFLQKGDSSNYFYALNSMAFELAEQGKKEETLALLDSICMNCLDKNVHIKTIETKAVACKRVQEYDSTIYYTSLAFKHGYYAPIILMNRAQAYSFLGKKDSAVYYAKKVLDTTRSLFDMNNALYILTHDDKSKDKNEIRQISADRSDIQKCIEILQGKLSQAVQLLQQDITRRPDLRWLYSTIGTLVLISFGLFFYVRKKHRKRELLSQQIEELENRNNDTIAQISAQIENNIALLSQSANLKEDLCWSDYNKMCVIINQQVGMLALKLQKTYKLSEREIRLCILTMLNLGYDEIADMLYYAPNGVGKLKLRVAKKLGTTSKNLHHFLLLIAVHEQQD